MAIVDIFGLKKQDGDIGIEIEVQGDDLPHVINDFWKVEVDGSLKGKGEGLEYVLRRPLKIVDVYPALVDWKRAFAKSNVYSSYHAGIHVHANLQKFSPKQVINLLVCLIILEDLLVKWCGPTREGNHFCLRTSDAEYLIHLLREMIEEGNFSSVMKENKGGDKIRYSAFNLKALYQYGSLEFRTLASTMDIERIHTWCQVIHRIVNEAQKFESPSSIVTDISVGGYDNFLRRLLGPYTAQFLTSDYTALMRHGVVRAQEIAFCKDWNSINMNIFKNKGGVF